MKATESEVSNFIGGLDKVFIIPPFQRNYEWSKEQCEELFHDIEDAYTKKKNHYLGNIVYYLGENNGAEYQELILIDGQQRVTTIILLICALRDSNKLNEELKRKVSTKYLINDTKNEKYRIRLKQTSNDYQSFLSIIENTTPLDENNNIVKNYRRFLELINDTEIPVDDIYNTILHLEIVSVNLQIQNDLETVQTIFEKINSTGKPLSAADLIRNYLLISKIPDEQQFLYDTYWVNIEKEVGNESISLLAKNYLIIKTFSDVENSEIYKRFKEFFKDTSLSHKEILEELQIFARYFNWMRNSNSPNKEINKIIQELNYLKTEDVYPLYLYLIDKLYKDNPDELIKIFLLLSDFMLRFRIVSPSGGGGALRDVIHKIIEKMDNNEIMISYKDIYYELSNSSTKSGRYPTNEDFTLALMQSRKTNHTYGKVLLRKIEEFETKNIGVPLNEITVEHFMPQTPTTWWNDNYGGTEKTFVIYEKYLNCIGNLGIMSQGYNSSNSNKPWPEKRAYIKKVQFNITKEVAENLEWKEKEIEKRNDDLAHRACLAVMGPKERSKPLFTVEFENGKYPASDINTDMTGAVVIDVYYNDKPLGINSWRYYFNEMCKIAYNLDNKLFEKIVEENLIHKNSSKKNGTKKDPVISLDANLLIDPKRIGNTAFYSEGSLSSTRARVFGKQLLDKFGITENIFIDVINNEN